MCKLYHLNTLICGSDAFIDGIVDLTGAGSFDTSVFENCVGITTVPEIFEKYFGSKHRVVALILSLGRDLGITASAVLVLSQIFTRLFGLDFWVSVALTAGVVVFFTSVGGE